MAPEVHGAQVLPDPDYGQKYGDMAVPRMALSPNGRFTECPLVWAFTECPYMGPFIEQFILETHCLR